MNREEFCLFYRTPHDEAFFEAATYLLPKRDESDPFHCGPHSVKSLRYVVDRFGKAPSVFEVGFNLGHSAALWLQFGSDRVHSIDKRTTLKMRDAADELRRIYGARITTQFDCTVVTCEPPDFMPQLAFIDGSHVKADIDADIAYCLKLGIQRFLFDDWPARYGDVQAAVYETRLVPLAVIGSMCYAVVPEADGFVAPTDLTYE